MRIDREIACDSFVLNTLEEDNYVEYGSTILNFADMTLHNSNFSFSADIGGSKNQIKKRIINIASFHPASKWLKTKSLLILVIMISITIVSAPNLSVRAEKDNIYKVSNSKVKYEDLSAYFDDYEGSFVLYNSKTDQYEIYNKNNSTKRVSPNSTYKIFSALFGLESGVITDKDSTIKWNESQYPYDSWNKDQNLNTAMKNSVNWYFQAVDNMIGMDKLQAYFNKVNYGNLDLSSGLSHYWLESSLKISPIEQVELLKAFYTNAYGFQEKNIKAVKDSLLLAQANGALLSGKTGTGNVNGKNINGWFIGYVESNENTYIFATNIQNDDYCNGSTATKITLSILEDKQIYTSN
jgi:bla regulator protein BlaR1